MEYRLTTNDNPYDPVTEFSQWIMYDKEKGYNTSEYLARMVEIPENSSESKENSLIESAIDEIISRDFLGVYKKVSRPT